MSDIDASEQRYLISVVDIVTGAIFGTKASLFLSLPIKQCHRIYLVQMERVLSQTHPAEKICCKNLSPVP